MLNTSNNEPTKQKPKKMSGFSTFTNNLSSLSIKNPTQENRQSTPLSPQPTLGSNSRAGEGSVHKVTEIEIKPVVIPSSPVPQAKEEEPATIPVIQEETKDDAKAEAREVVKKEKPAQKKAAPLQRRNSQKIKSERSNSAGREQNKGINFAIGTECEEKFIFCHRKQRMSRNSYFNLILENEKRKYESDKDAYIQKNLSKLMEEKKVPGRDEKKTVIKTDQEIFDFVTDVSYDFYCNKDKFIRFAIRKEYERCKRQQ